MPVLLYRTTTDGDVCLEPTVVEVIRRMNKQNQRRAVQEQMEEQQADHRDHDRPTFLLDCQYNNYAYGTKKDDRAFCRNRSHDTSMLTVRAAFLQFFRTVLLVQNHECELSLAPSSKVPGKCRFPHVEDDIYIYIPCVD